MSDLRTSKKTGQKKMCGQNGTKNFWDFPEKINLLKWYKTTKIFCLFQYLFIWSTKTKNLVRKVKKILWKVKDWIEWFDFTKILQKYTKMQNYSSKTPKDTWQLLQIWLLTIKVVYVTTHRTTIMRKPSSILSAQQSSILAECHTFYQCYEITWKMGFDRKSLCGS